jgi:long-chain acyl-CoA synthetase
MNGYYKEPELTKEVFDAEGWFHTGDLGQIEPEGQLRITGRKKEMFKTSMGKYIIPQMIEEKFRESRFIEQIIVTGEHQKFAGALIVPDFGFLKSWCEVKGVEYSTNPEMVLHPRIKKRFAEEVKKLNKNFGETEKIKSYELMGNEWTFESGEITPTLKLKRNFIMKKYKAEIEKLFQ